MRLASRLCPVVWALALLAVAAHLAKAGTVYFTWYHAVLSAIIVAGGVATLVQLRWPSVAVRLCVSMTALLVGGVLLVMHFLGQWPFAFDPFPNSRYVLFLVAANAIPFVGLAFRQIWARWIGIAYGIFGGLSAALNLVGTLCWANEVTWLLALGTFGYALLAWNLASPAVGAAFLAQNRHAPLWGSRDPVIHAVRSSLIANLGAIAMLLVYGWLQPFVRVLAPVGFALAGWLAVGAILTLLRRSAGPLMIALGGLGLLAIVGATVTLADSEEQFMRSFYYAVFWVPAGLLGLRAGVMMVRRSSTAPT